MDRQEVEFYRRVKQGYRELAERDPGRWRAIDGSPGPADVYRAVRAEAWPTIDGWLRDAVQREAKEGTGRQPSPPYEHTELLS